MFIMLTNLKLIPEEIKIFNDTFLMYDAKSIIFSPQEAKIEFQFSAQPAPAPTAGRVVYETIQMKKLLSISSRIQKHFDLIEL